MKQLDTLGKLRFGEALACELTALRGGDQMVVNLKSG